MLDVGSGSGCSPLWQLCKRVVSQTCPESCMGWGWMVAEFGQRLCKDPSEAVTSLRLLENTPGWLARALLLFCLQGMCLHSFSTGLRVTQPSSSVASLCLSAQLFWALVQPLTTMPNTAQLIKSAPQDQDLQTAREVQLPYFGASFKQFSLPNHTSALQNIIFFLRFSPSPSPTESQTPSCSYKPSLSSSVHPLSK